MLGHHWGKCQISLVLASGVQMRKEGHRERLCLLTKKTITPAKCRFLSKFPKAHSCTSMLTFIKGPCLCCFRKYLDTRSQASQVLSLSSSFSARPSHSPRWSSFSFPVIFCGGGREERVRKEARNIESAGPKQTMGW